MASETKKSEHECSCGRTFRHGISLKRHQKVAGCEALELEVASAKVVTPKAQPESTQDETRTQVITAAQIAEWQARTASPTAIEEEPSVRWEFVRETAEEFVDFVHEIVATAGRRLGFIAQVGMRFTLFGGFLVALGWVLLFGISQDLAAAPAHTATDDALQMQAQSTVKSFLQTLQLGQYDRAHTFLTAKARKKVSASDLESLAQMLSLGRGSQESTASLSQAGLVAEVNIRNGASNHKFTLVQEPHGWSVASVSAQ